MARAECIRNQPFPRMLVDAGVCVSVPHKQCLDMVVLCCDWVDIRNNFGLLIHDSRPTYLMSSTNGI